MNPIVSATGLTKRFGPVVALRNTDLELHIGEVVGLIGQNGSGKSSLLKTIAGLQEPDEGQIVVRGQAVRLRSPLDAIHLGIGLVHQEQSLIGNLTVAENIFLDKPNAARRHGWYSWPRMFSAAKKQLEKVESSVDPGAIVETLTFAERQMVELAKVLAIEEMTHDRIVILLDEPTAVLAPADIETLFRQIRRLRTTASIVFVSHRMDEVMTICDRVVVMADGEKVAERETRKTRREELYHLMVGHHRAAGRHGGHALPHVAGTPVRLCVDRLCVPGRLSDVSFEVRAGEIVGLAGVLGSGAEELCRALFGIDELVTGIVELNGVRIAPKTPAEAIGLGLGYVPADRKGEGLLRGRSILDNMVITCGLDYGLGGIIVDHGREQSEAATWMSRLKIVARSPWESIENLSGGNQQKAVMGKWLMSPRLQVLLLDHPTRGLDPGARDEVYTAIREAAAKGLAIIFVGDAVEEILEVSDKIVVMRDGCITARFDRSEQSEIVEEELMAAMV